MTPKEEHDGSQADGKKPTESEQHPQMRLRNPGGQIWRFGCRRRDRNEHRISSRKRSGRLTFLGSDSRNWGNEAVTAPRDSFDIDRSVRDIAQGIAELHHGRVHAVFEVDKRTCGPEQAAQILAADEFACMLEEIDKHVKRLLAYPNWNSIAAQLQAVRIHLKNSESPDAVAVFHASQIGTF
jgi:hypothetical protein